MKIIGTRKKTLKTGFPNGKHLVVVITQATDQVLIDTDREFDFLKTMPELKDKRSILKSVNFNFSSGQFHIKCSYNQYALVLIDFTKYLENVIFSAMLEVEKREAKNDNKNTSDSGDTDSERDKKRNSSGSNGKDKKKGFGAAISGILSSSGGSKQSPDGGSGKKSSDSLAKESDSDS